MASVPKRDDFPCIFIAVNVETMHNIVFTIKTIQTLSLNLIRPELREKRLAMIRYWLRPEDEYVSVTCDASFAAKKAGYAAILRDSNGRFRKGIVKKEASKGTFEAEAVTRKVGAGMATEEHEGYEDEALKLDPQRKPKKLRAKFYTDNEFVAGSVRRRYALEEEDQGVLDSLLVTLSNIPDYKVIYIPRPGNGPVDEAAYIARSIKAQSLDESSHI